MLPVFSLVVAPAESPPPSPADVLSPPPSLTDVASPQPSPTDVAPESGGRDSGENESAGAECEVLLGNPSAAPESCTRDSSDEARDHSDNYEDSENNASSDSSDKAWDQSSSDEESATCKSDDLANQGAGKENTDAQTQGRSQPDMSYNDYMEELFRLQRESCSWPTGPINLTFSRSLADDSPRVIDITPTIGKGKNVPKSPGDSNCYWLMSHLNQNNAVFRAKRLHPMFILACAEAGFRAWCKYDHRKKSFHVMCCRSQFHREDVNRKTTEKLSQRYVPSTSTIKRKQSTSNAAKTQRPIHPNNVAAMEPADDDSWQEIDVPSDDAVASSTTDDDAERDNKETCPFKFLVYWDDVHERWFLPHKQRGCIDHCGHLKINPKHLRLRTAVVMDDDNLQVAKDSFSSKIRAAPTRNLMQTRTGHTLAYHQVQYIGRKQKEEEMSKRGVQLCHSTVIDRLVATVTNDPTISWVMLLAERESEMITIKMKRMTAGGLSAETVDFEEDLDDLLDSPVDHAESLRDRLMHSPSGQILLAFAWATDESRRKFDMFPEAIGEDGTCGTNREERDLHTVIGKDQNNKIFAVLSCFMPCRGQWAFSWIEKVAMPYIHPGTALARVQKIVTDADPQMTRAIEAIAGGNGATECSIYPAASHGLCVWHVLDRNFKNHAKYKALFAAAKDKSVFARAEIDAILRWMWYFARIYETKGEIKVASAFLLQYLSEPQDSHFAVHDEEFRRKIKEFVSTKYLEKGQKLFDAHFPGMTLGLVTSSNNESYHRAVKEAEDGPRPCDGLDEARELLDTLEARRNTLKSQRTAFDVMATMAKKSDRKYRVNKLSDYCNKELIGQHGHGAINLLYRFEKDGFYVKRDYNDCFCADDSDLKELAIYCDGILDELEDLKVGVDSREKKALREIEEKLLGAGHGSLPEYKKIFLYVAMHIIPRFEHTRTVKIVLMSNNEYVLVCSCSMWKKHGRACRHLYSVLKRRPSVRDANIRWHNGYAHEYGIVDCSSEKYLELRDKFAYPGVPLTAKEVVRIRGMMDVGEGDRPLDFFEATLGKLRLRRGLNGTHWAKNRDKLPSELQECIPCPLDNDEGSGMASEMDSVDENQGGGGRDEREEGDAATAAEPDEAPSAAGLTANQQLSGRSKYTVPSQMHEVDDVIDLTLSEVENTKMPAVGNGDNSSLDNSDDDSFSLEVGGPRRRRDAFQDFMPMYQQLCQLASAPGEQGKKCHGIMNVELKNLRKKLYSAGVDGSKDSTCRDCASYPVISTKRVAVRKKMATSPAKRHYGKRQRDE